MKEEKEIDNIFREKLENFKVQPPPFVWENVQVKLAAVRRRNRLVYLGWISAAAVVVLAFLAGWYFNDNLKENNLGSIKNEIAQQEKDRIEATVQKEETTEQNTFSTKPETTGYSEPAQNVEFAINSAKSISNKSEATNYKTRELFQLTRLESADARLVQNQQPSTELAIQTKTTPTYTFTQQDQLLIAENVKNIKAASKPENNWKMGMFVAPGYSSYNASHTESYSQNMTYSGSEGNSNVSGGVSVQYKTSKRWIVESGVYYAQNGQESNNSANIFANNKQADNMFSPGDVNYFSNSVRVENNNLAMNSTAGVIAFNATPKGAELSGDFDAAKSTAANLMVPDGQFSQVFEFMEIPLLVRYRVVDSKVGVELITGLNAGIIVGNNAYIENQYGLQNIGETQDISTVNLSGTVGVGVNYALGKHFAVALEPRFNYYLNSINNNPSVDFRPYRIGFYTGLTYGF